jgi:hypothetical protein
MLMKKIISTVFAVLVVFVFLNSASAQVEPISPDRPDQTESPHVVPLNSFQVETGVVFEKTVADGLTTKNLSYPSVVLRYGILSNFELRMDIEHVKTTLESDGTSSSVSGMAPLSLGFKMNVCDEKGLRPAAGFEIYYTLPNLASKEFKNEFVGTSLLLALENSVTDKFTVGYNIGASWDGNSPEPTFGYSLSLDYEITKRVSGFAEVYGFMPEKTRADHRFDFGLSYLALNNLIFDTSAGVGITNNAPDFFISGGFSFRLPK